MITMFVRVQTVFDRYPVQEYRGKIASWEGTQRMEPKKAAPGKKDRFACLNAEGVAQVKVGLEEKLSGPTGTYSSISVYIEVSARCDQNEKAIGEAHEALFTEGMKAMEFYISPALNMLIEHTERQMK